MKKIILTFIATLLAGLGSVTAQNVAKIGNQEFSSLADAVAAVQSNYTITLLQNTEVTSMGNIEGKTGVVIDLGGYTINLKANNIHVNNGSEVTIQNGSIDITGNNASGDCIIGIGAYNTSTNTLTLKKVTIQGNGYSSAYGVLYAYDYSGSVNTINLNQCVVDLKNDASSSGGVFKMASTNDILNIYNSNITLDKTQRGITTGTVTINNTVFTMTNGDNGINSSNLTVENSDISITNGSGRGITAGSAPMVINGHSTVTLSGNAEGDLRLDANSSVSVQGESSLSAASIKENGGTIANNITVASTAEMDPFVAKVGTTFCTTLEAAFTAAEDGQTITLLADCTGNGIIVPQGKFTTGLTVDFNNFTYTVDRDPLAGSTGTKSQAFQLLKGNTITFKNGTIYSEKARMLVQNYSNLTLEGMTLTLNNTEYTSPAYTLSNNNGNVVIDGTTINANNENSFAFDVCRYSSYPSVSVTVKGNSVINGNVEISASANNAKDGFGLSLESGTLNGQIIVDASAATAMESTPDKVSVTKSSSFTAIVPGYTWDADGKLVAAPVVAQIGTLGYSSLEDAFAAVKNGQTITLQADVTLAEDITVPAEPTDGLSLILNLGDYSISGEGKIKLQAKVDVTTDSRQDELFASAVEGEEIQVKTNTNMSYTYMVGNEVYWNWTAGDDTEGTYTTFDEPFISDSPITAGKENIELQRNVTLNADIECTRKGGILYLILGGHTITANGHHVLLPAPTDGARALVPSEAATAGLTIYTDELTDIFAAAAEGYTILVAPSDDDEYAYAYQVVKADDEIVDNAVARNKETGMLFKDLQLAVTVASDGNTIELLPAIENVTLEETVTIDKALTIEGQNLTITAAYEKENSWEPDYVKPAILVKGNGDVTINKVKLDVSYTNEDSNGYTDGGIAIQAADGYSGKLTLDYCDIKTSNRGVDVQDVATGFALDVKNSTISGKRGGDDAIDDDNVKETYINTFDLDPYQSARGINLSNGQVACGVKVENTTIQGLAYAINISAYVEDVQTPAYSSYVTLDVKDSQLYGRGGVNVWGTHNTITLDNVTVNGINNQTEGNTETFACIVENELAQYNDYYIKGTKVSAAVLATTEYETDADGELVLDDDGQPIPVEGTNATQKFLDLRGKDATVKITGDSGFAVDAADKDRTGFMNNEQILNLINPEINNRVYFDAPSKAYFSYYFESMPLMTDGDDKQFRLGISDETDETNLYPVKAIYPKVMLTMSTETGEVDDDDMPVYEMNYYYYETLESAFASEFFADQAQLNLLDNVELNDDITVNLKRGENFTLTAGDYTVAANGHNIILPTLVFAFTDIVNEENAPLYKVQDEDLTALLGTPEEEGYYVPANVYWAADVTDISGQYWLFDELFTKTNEDIAIWPDSYTRLEREITLERNLKFPTEVGEGGIEEIEPVDGGARRMVDGDVVDRDYWIDFNDFDLLPGDDYSIILKLGNYVYTTKTTDIFTSGEAGYRVIYDKVEETVQNEKGDPVTFLYKYYLIKDGIAVTVDPATYCGDRLTPTFVVKKKVVVDDEETWVELRGITKDEYDERVANTPEGEEVNLTGIDFYWHLVPPADPDDDKTYIDAKTYSNALVIEGITFAGSEKADFVILPRDIKDVTVDGNVQPYTAGGYDAAAIEALISAVYNCTTHTTTTGEGDAAVTTNNSVDLVVDKDYKITVEDGPEVVENVGKYIDSKTYKQVITLTAVEGGNYTGTLKVDFIIGGEDDIALAEILAETIYNGAAQLPKTKTAEDVEDATVIVHNVKGVELYGVTFEEGTTPTDAQLKKESGEYYDFFMTYKKVANVEYDYPTTANNEYTNADTYKMAVTITGIGNYHGHKTVDYVIKPKDIAGCTVDGLIMDYTGSEISVDDIIANIKVTDPEIVTVVSDEAQAKELQRLLGDVVYEYEAAVSSDYTYKEVQVYPNAVTITGQHNYTGTLNLNFQIVPKDAVDIAQCLVVSKAVYTSTVQEPSYETIQLTDRNGNIVDKKYYTITVNGTATGDNVEYINAKTYSNAMTISAITPEGENPKYYGSFNADYVIKQRDLADSEMGNDKGYVVLEAYAGADATTTDPETFPLQWTGNALVPVINGADANNINLLLQYQNAVKDNDEPDGTYELVAVDYTYTIEPSPMKDPGLYKIIFTGRGNFTGMREVNVMVLKDINELADNIKMPYQIIPDNLALTPSQMKGIEVKDGNKVLVENEEYTLVIKGGKPGEIFDETTPIYVKGKYYACFYGKEPYYTGQYVDDFRAFFEYIGWDTNYPASGNGTNIYNNPTSIAIRGGEGNTIAHSGLEYDSTNKTPVSVRITDVSDSLNLKAEITYIDNINEGTVTACDPTKEIVKVNPTFQIVAGFDNGAARSFIFNIVGVQDNAFKNLPMIHCLDLTQIKGYTPDNLTRSEDGPFNEYPVQSLVYLNGSNVTGTNYIYTTDDETYLCEELKIYDDLAGDQQDIRQNEGTYAWEFKNIYEFTADKVTNTRKFNKDQHYTICLPYQLQMTDDLKAYSLDASSSQILGFKELNTPELAQFTPYVLIPSKAGNLLNNANTTTVYTTDVTPASVTAGSATLTGSNVYVEGADAAGKYIMQGKDPNHNEWRVIGADNGYGDGDANHGPCILPMRAYISITGGSREVLMAKYMDKIDSMPVEIETNELEGAEVYDLQGRKVDTTRTTLRKGVYVVNGQKRMIK